VEEAVFSKRSRVGFLAILRWGALFGQIGALASVTLGGRSGFGLSIDLMGSSASKGAVRPYMAVPP
jgi:hypothetical protein